MSRTSNEPRPRGALADARDEQHLYLMKFPSVLRATYQIRLLTFMAMKQKKKLVVTISTHTKISDDLARLEAKAAGALIFRRENEN